MKNKQLSARQRSRASFALLHLLWIFLIAASALTGLRIRADNPNSSLEILEPILPQGSVWLWHILFAAVLIGLFVAYLWLYRIKHKKLIPTAKTISHYPLNSIAYSGLIIIVIGSFVSGLLQLIDADFNHINLVHRLCAYGFGLFAIIHTLAHIQQSGLKRLLRLLPPLVFTKLSAAVIGICLITTIGCIFWLVNNAITLEVKYITAPIIIDGYANESSWQQAPAVAVLTKHGANLHQGKSIITARALYDADNIYLYLKWQDPTRSQKHLPLIKTANGWKILQSNFEFADENQFYEDKLAILLANRDALANLKSIHLGKNPLPGQPESLNGRGYHYTTGGKIYDLWHWQSVRSNNHYQADDSYFGAALKMPTSFPQQNTARAAGTFDRYSAGYLKDPPSEAIWSGVSANWEPYTTGYTQPRRLPAEYSDIKSIQGASLNANSSDGGNWWLSWGDSEPYSRGKDNYPVGTILPSVLLNAKRVQDRGDITARGRWENGYWHLEIKRALDTGSDFDVAISDDTYLWFAIFDHSQTRHSRHLRPLRLQLIPPK